MILARIIADEVGYFEQGTHWAQEALFGPLGITSVEHDLDDSGVMSGGSNINMTARDFARFGLLYLRGGSGTARRSCPRSGSTTPACRFPTRPSTGPTGGSSAPETATRRRSRRTGSTGRRSRSCPSSTSSSSCSPTSRTRARPRRRPRHRSVRRRLSLTAGGGIPDAVADRADEGGDGRGRADRRRLDVRAEVGRPPRARAPRRRRRRRGQLDGQAEAAAVALAGDGRGGGDRSRRRPRRRGHRLRRRRPAHVPERRPSRARTRLRRLRPARPRRRRPARAAMERTSGAARGVRSPGAAAVDHAGVRRRRRDGGGDAGAALRGDHGEARGVDLPVRPPRPGVGQGEVPQAAGDGRRRLQARRGQPRRVVRVAARRRPRSRRRRPAVRRRRRYRLQRAHADVGDGRAAPFGDAECPFAVPPKLPRGTYRWVRPELVAEVAVPRVDRGRRHPRAGVPRPARRQTPGRESYPRAASATLMGQADLRARVLRAFGASSASAASSAAACFVARVRFAGAAVVADG